MHIFISYAKKDSRELAQRLYTILNSLPNISAWMDASLQPADSWASQIEKEIDRCDYLLVLLSPDVNRPKTESQAASFLLKEINYAQAQNKRLIVAMAGTTKIPIQIADEQYIDFTQNLDEGLRKLVQFLLQQEALRPQQVMRYDEPEIVEMPKSALSSSKASTEKAQEKKNVVLTADPRSWLQVLNWGSKAGIGCTGLLLLFYLFVMISNLLTSSSLSANTAAGVAPFTILMAIIFIGGGHLLGVLAKLIWRALEFVLSGKR